MTCIAAVVERGRVYMAADSAGTDQWTQNIRSDGKMFLLSDDMLVGVCGSFRVRDLIRYKFPALRYDAKQCPEIAQFIVTDFVEALRQTLKEGGSCLTNDGAESFDATVLVAYKGRLFEVSGDFQVGEQTVPYHAIGSGSDIAQGSLYSTCGLKMSARKRLEKAMEASERYNAGVRAPFHHMTL
jgi:ATP-dependent protease HslVU (ClpYQ) peptidase subunit